VQCLSTRSKRRTPLTGRPPCGQATPTRRLVREMVVTAANAAALLTVHGRVSARYRDRGCLYVQDDAALPECQFCGPSQS
jgi:hypothetical protein